MLHELYSYNEAIEELNNSVHEDNIQFNDLKEKYDMRKCWDDKIKWCKQDQGIYMEVHCYSKNIQEYMKNTQFKKVIGVHPWV